MNYLPEALCIKLNGLSLDMAIKQGLIYDLGDNDGILFHPLNEQSDRYFAIVNGFKVICSRRLMAYSKEERDSWLGLMNFFRYEDNDRFEFRLCTPVFLIPETNINVKDYFVSKND